MRFKDKVAIVTGGSAGMGKASAIAFAREGANVVINGRNKEKLEIAADEIRQAGGEVTIAPGDITKDEVIYSIVEKTLEDYGKIDILFNYVGGNPENASMELFIKQKTDYWEQMLRVNLWSTIIFCRAVLDSMIEKKYGKIINTSAAAGKMGAATMAVYSAAKGGVIAFTKALAQEVKPFNINVNCICPGAVDTPGFAEISSKGPVGMATDRPPVEMSRIGTPEEIASAVLYLASDDAAYITGQPLSVDGGLTMM